MTALLAGWDAVSFVDVLYLLGWDQAQRLLQAAAAALVPGGVVVIKEMDVQPAWKRRLNHVQELLATRVVRTTQGDQVEVVPPTVLVGELERAGLTVGRQRLDRGRLHPHHLIVGQRPSR